MGLVRFPGSWSRYLSGLCVATIGLCAAGWLALAPVAFGYQRAGLPGGALRSGALRSEALHRAALTDWATAAGLAVVSLVTLVSWVVAWRRKLRADGILARTSRRQARRGARTERRRERAFAAAAGTPDPAQVLSELRALLTPLLAEPANEPGEPDAGHREQDRDDPGHRTPSGEPDGDHQPALSGYGTPGGYGTPAQGVPAVPAARSGGRSAMESMLAGAELLTVGCGEEEEAW